MIEEITKYIIATVIHFILGAGLLTCAILATRYNEDEDSFTGPPFFIGGYIVGILQLLAALLAGCVLRKSMENEEASCMVFGHIAVGMLTFMGCLIGFVFAGIFGVSSFGNVDDEDQTEQAVRNRKIAYAIIAGCAGAIFATVFTMYLTCNGGPSPHTTSSVGTVHARNITTAPAAPTETSNFLELLRNQNRLLQEQLSLQRQVITQQQQQQQQQQQYLGDPFSQPPPPYSTVMSNPNYTSDPAYPPPAYPGFGK